MGKSEEAKGKTTTKQRAKAKKNKKYLNSSIKILQIIQNYKIKQVSRSKNPKQVTSSNTMSSNLTSSNFETLCRFFFHEVSHSKIHQPRRSGFWVEDRKIMAPRTYPGHLPKAKHRRVRLRTRL